MSHQPFAIIKTDNGICECYSYKAFRILAEKLVAKSTQMMVEDAMIYGAGAIKIERVDPPPSPTAKASINSEGAQCDCGRSTCQVCGTQKPIPVGHRPAADQPHNVANYHWALSRINDYRLNDLPNPHGHRFGDGDIARLICKLIEEPETLERSELYQMRINAISAAANGYGTRPEEAHQAYITRAYRDGYDLYGLYDKAASKLVEAGFSRDPKGEWVGPQPGQVNDDCITQVADIFEQRSAAECEADNVRLRKHVDELIKTLSGVGAELKLVVDVATQHGWSEAQGSVGLVIDEWLKQRGQLAQELHVLRNGPRVSESKQAQDRPPMHAHLRPHRNMQLPGREEAQISNPDWFETPNATARGSDARYNPLNQG